MDWYPSSLLQWIDGQQRGFPGGSEVNNLPTNAGNIGSILGWGRFPGEGNGNPLKYSCLENPMDIRAWQATVHGVTKSQIQLSMRAHTHRYYEKQRFSQKWGSIVSHYQTTHFSQILLQQELLQVPASASEATPHSFQFSSIMRMVKQDWRLGLSKTLQVFSFPWHLTWNNPEERGNTFSQQKSKTNSYLIWIFKKIYPYFISHVGKEGHINHKNS